MPFDEVHVVLDDENREPELVPELADQLRDLVGLDGVHAGGGLVEQEDPGVGRHRPGDLEPPPIGVRERVGRLVPAIAHQPLAEERELLLGRSSRIARSSLRIPGVRSIDRTTPALV